MLNVHDILETITMIQDENLDIRTITMGISLLDCIDADIDIACQKVYDKILRCAKDLVKIASRSHRLSRFFGSMGVRSFIVDLGVLHQTGTGRDQLTDDDILLQADQRIDLALDGCFGEDTGGFLEGSRRHERLSSQRCLGNTQQHRCGSSHSPVAAVLSIELSDLFVGSQELALIHDLAGDSQKYI